MRFAICFSVWLSVVASAAVLLGWTSYYHLTVGGAALVAFATLVLAWTLVRHARKSHRSTRLQESQARSILVAVLLAIVALGTVRAAFAIADGIPGVNPYFHDADRPEFVARLEYYQAAGDFDTAAKIVRDRLTQPISPAWKGTLEAELAQFYVKAGIHASEPLDQTRYFDMAVQATRTAGQDVAAVESLLEQAKRENDYLTRIHTLRAGGRWRDLIDEMEVAVKSPQPWRHPFADWLVEACIQVGESAESVEVGVQFFDRAVQVAETYAIDSSHAQALLANALQQRDHRGRVRAELEKMLAQAENPEDLTIRLHLLQMAADYARRHALNVEHIHHKIQAIQLALQPRPFAPGTTAKLLDVDDRDPFMLVDFVVRSAQGTPIILEAKDVASVSVAGKAARVESLGLAPPRAAPSYIVLCLDYSASTTGEPQRHARTGAGQLFASLDAKFQLVAFSDKVWNLSNSVWSSDPTQLRAQLNLATVGGGTQLVSGLNYAARRFPEDAEHRTVILLSDGVDSGGRNPANALAYCIENGITVHTIGLRGGDRFDAETLKSIATSTGGRYFEASQSGELVTRFVQAAAEIRQRPLRLVCKASAPGSVELTIGGGKHALRLSSH